MRVQVFSLTDWSSRGKSVPLKSIQIILIFILGLLPTVLFGLIYVLGFVNSFYYLNKNLIYGNMLFALYNKTDQSNGEKSAKVAVKPLAAR